MKNKLFILTLSWNGADKLNSLYHSLIPNLTDIDYRWLIKDNGSKDNSLETISTWKNSNVIAFDYKDNKQNFSEGCNLLFNVVENNNSNINEDILDDEDYILLLNNDIIFNDEQSLKKMIQIMEDDEHVGVVGCKLTYPNSDKIAHSGVVFSERTWKLPINYRDGQIEESKDRLNREFQAITGAVLLTKVKYYKEIYKTNKSNINGLNELFVWSFDDVDACLSIKYNLNKKVIYCGETNISHSVSATLKKNPINKLMEKYNINLFLKLWSGKYIYDRELYMNDPKFNLYKKVLK